MRALPLLFAVVLTGCGKNQDSDSSTTPTGTWTGAPTGTATGTATGTGTTATGTGTGTGTGTATGGSGSGGSGSTTDTVYEGSADLDLAGLTWTGGEAAQVVSTISGTLLCQWSWTALDWANDPAVGTAPEPAVAACTDGDGNPCLFDFTVNLSQGMQTDGICAPYGFAVDGGAYHYGYTDDWFQGGVSYGSQFAYYLPGGGTSGMWFPVMQYGAAIWTPGAGQTGQIQYQIRKTLLVP